MSFTSRARSALSLLVALGALACGGASTSVPVEGAPLTPHANGSEAAPRGTQPALGSAGAVGALMPELPSSAPTAWLNGAPVRVASPPGDLLLVESWHRL